MVNAIEYGTVPGATNAHTGGTDRTGATIDNDAPTANTRERDWHTHECTVDAGHRAHATARYACYCHIGHSEATFTGSAGQVMHAHALCHICMISRYGRPLPKPGMQGNPPPQSAPPSNTYTGNAHNFGVPDTKAIYRRPPPQPLMFAQCIPANILGAAPPPPPRPKNPPLPSKFTVCIYTNVLGYRPFYASQSTTVRATSTSTAAARAASAVVHALLTPANLCFHHFLTYPIFDQSKRSFESSYGYAGMFTLCMYMYILFKE
jgi:hypothetical protein